MIKVISFDLDGTLTDYNFDSVFWLKEIPKLYAQQHKVPFKEAYKIVTAQYNKTGPDELLWYDVDYWFKKFRLKHNWKKILKDLKHHISLYKDVTPALKKLKNKYKLIIITNSIEDFLKLKLKVENLDKYFSKIYSVTSHLKSPRKHKHIYEKILKDLKIRPDEIIHIGDDKEFDYAIPKKLGIKCFLIDRKGKYKGNYVIRSLKQFLKRIT